MNRFLKVIESIKKRNQRRGINHLEKYFGQPITVFPPTKDIYTEVYGVTSGEVEKDDSYEIEGILTSDDFFPEDALRSGAFNEGWLYTGHRKDIQAGSTIEVEGKDKKSRIYKVIERQAYGSTTEVFKKYRLSAMDQ